MDDLISRKAVIDKAITIPIAKIVTEDKVIYRRIVFVEDIENLPSAQSDIIHCKDCKYWQDQEEGIVEVPICARPQNKYEKFPLVMLIDGDGFCSYAERRTND